MQIFPLQNANNRFCRPKTIDEKHTAKIINKSSVCCRQSDWPLTRCMILHHSSLISIHANPNNENKSKQSKWKWTNTKKKTNTRKNRQRMERTWKNERTNNNIYRKTISRILNALVHGIVLNCELWMVAALLALFVVSRMNKTIIHIRTMDLNGRTK